jgi:hypothetical protein
MAEIITLSLVVLICVTGYEFGRWLGRLYMRWWYR